MHRELCGYDDFRMGFEGERLSLHLTGTAVPQYFLT